MSFLRIEYISKGKDICIDDILKKRRHPEFISLKQISSFSEVKIYRLLSGESAGEYAELRMTNGNLFYITKDSQEKIKESVMAHH